MSEHSVQVVISGQGGQQIQLRWQGATSDRPMVLQVASSSTPAPLRLDRGGTGIDAGAGVTVLTPQRGSAISLELHLRHASPPVVAAPTEARRETAPLATAWATEHLRARASSSRPPRARSSRPPQ